ncbi:hypothetical protein ABXV22_24415 [Vibrio rotiferianus]|uniref:hypothetical protein n=1 Tax=Vibrio rotiferianus TaxID=190895 RepID=UPI00039AFFC0|nr:hypothetical protein [Vibrio rotiferianus]PIB17224.1 hypothetical protein B853_07377 [Vibrio rotiferianus CAIM 577 = LMG 21460]
MSLPDHIQNYVGHQPTSDNSFFGDLTKWGSGLMDDVGETFGVVKDAYLDSVKGYAADVAANPNTQKQYSNYADQHGNKITQPQGQAQMPRTQAGFMGFSNQQLMIGGLAVVALLVLAKR